MSCFFQPGFEYTVTVPNPKDNYSKNQEDCNFNFTFDESRKPMVLLFGWAGSSDRNLKIYSRIYEAKGFMTVRFIVTVASMFVWKDHIYPISKKIVEVIENINPVSHPIFVHCFSNGGSYLYQYFLDEVKFCSTPIIIKGVIFDSAPCKTTIDASFKAIRLTVNQNKILNLPYSILLQLLFFGIWICEWIQMVILRRTVIQFKPMENLLKEENRCPQHFIYSRADKVIAWKDVEYFINERKSKGVEVSVKIYDDTDHVRHYPFKKYSYTQSIFNFISQCQDLESSVV